MNAIPRLSRLRIPRPLLFALGFLWIFGLGMGLRSMWAYESQPGSPAQPPTHWAPGARSVQIPSRPTLLLMAHPRCPCTGATLDELERIMTQVQDSLEARVYFYQPLAAAEGWSRTALWRRASSLPGVQVVADDDGRMAHRFGAKTSGQAFLYGADGRLLFSGGLTDSRGHSSKSVGGEAILSLLSQPRTEQVTTPVFGCSLVAPAPTSGPNDKG